MANIPYKLYKQREQSGVIQYQLLPGTNTPYGYTEVTDPTEAYNYLNQLRSMGAYTPGSRTGVQFDAPGVARDLEETLRQYESKVGKTAVVDKWTNPLTGEVLTNIEPSKIKEIEQMNADIQSGKLVDIGGGRYVPPGSTGQMQPNTQTLGNMTGDTGQQGSNMSFDYPSQNLQPGMSGEAVKQLQNWLISQGYSIPAGATGYYGDQTKAAVAQLQQDKGVDTAGNPGFWGPRTIGAIQSSGQGGGTYDGTGGSGGGTAGDSQGGGLADQLSEPFRQLYDTMKGFLDELKSRGQNINADIEITPERAAEFMKQAEGNLDAFLPYADKEIAPFFQNQLKMAREGFLRGVGYTTQELLKTEQDLERRFQKSSVAIGESAAEKGFALSGARQKEEAELTDTTQRDIQEGRRIFGYNIGNEARKFAQRFGTAEVPNMSIASTPKVGDTGFVRGGPDQPVYELSPELYAGLTGEEEYKQRAATRTRASELESAFRSQSALDQERKLLI